MPFTFSHPAIILPFTCVWKKRFSATALIIGSIAPDFEYFIRFHNASYHSHTWAGVFWFDLPAGLILCFVFHDIVKTTLILNLPAFLRNRFVAFLDFNWKGYFLRHWFIVLYSLLLGIVSHLLWDRFTHQSYRFFNVVPGLKDSLDPDFHPNLVYRLIQMSYSAFGLLVIAWTVWRLPVKEGFVDIRDIKAYWLLFGFFAISIFGVSILATGFEYVDWITSPISSGLIALGITSFLHIKDKRVLVTGWK